MNDAPTASTENDPEYRPVWKNRQKVIFGTLIFCGVIILYLVFLGEAESRLQETIAMGCFILGGATGAAYIGWATYEDVARIKIR